MNLSDDLKRKLLEALYGFHWACHRATGVAAGAFSPEMSKAYEKAAEAVEEICATVDPVDRMAAHVRYKMKKLGLVKSPTAAHQALHLNEALKHLGLAETRDCLAGNTDCPLLCEAAWQEFKMAGGATPTRDVVCGNCGGVYLIPREMSKALFSCPKCNPPKSAYRSSATSVRCSNCTMSFYVPAGDMIQSSLCEGCRPRPKS